MNVASIGRRARGVLLSLGLGTTVACSAEPPAPPVETPVDPPAPTCTPAAVAEQTVAVRNDFGRLEGTLLVPGGCGPHPVALIIAGSGPTDRDGNGPQMYRLLAEALAGEGIASLRYDKGGVGASRGAIPAPEDMVVEMGAHDAALLVKALREDARFGPVTVVGHSEGSLLAMLATREASVDRFVSLAGAGRPIGVVLREQLARSIRDEALRARADEIIAALERGERVSDVPEELATLFHPNAQGYFISWMKYDPAAELSRAPFARVLVVQGATDIQVSLDDARRLVGARPDARLVVVDGMNHVLKEARGTTAAAQKDAYDDPSLPVVPRLVSEIAEFAGGP